MKKVNLHSHTQFCDGKAPMEIMAEYAFNKGFETWGFSPHSPVPIESPCNMSSDDVEAFIDEATRLKKKYAGRMEILTGMEIDYLTKQSNPSSPYYQKLSLDYRIGSVHYVPTQTGVLVDCDGNAERFKKYLAEFFNGDLEYVVKTYFSQVMKMIEAGGFDIVGHIDKIAGNASEVDPEIENTDWYKQLVEDAIRAAVRKNLTIEINTKAYGSRGRFYPDQRWWNLLKELNAKVIFSTDAHHPDKVDAGLDDAVQLYFNNSLS